MLRKDIQKIAAYTGKPCATIILPVEAGFTADRINMNNLRKALAEAEASVLQKWPAADVKGLIKNLDDIKEHITVSQHNKGIGIFAGNDFLNVTDLPFTPSRFVGADTRFEVRDLMYELDRLVHYFVALVDMHSVRLLSGIGDSLEEVFNRDFPSRRVDNFEYASPHPLTRVNMTSGGEEKSQNIEYRVREFFRVIHKEITPYLQNHRYPLFVMGPVKTVSYFIDELKLKDQAAAVVNGNYNKTPAAEILRHIYPEIEKYEMIQQENVIEKIEDSINKNEFTSSLQPVWEAVTLGNCRTLIVEKDFREKGYISKDHMQVSENDTSLDIEVDDIVDMLIREAMEKQAEVVFVEDGRLAEYGHIGLIKRYQ